ncbi:hypothetical protein LTR05_007389 [Lithohypha guttulata]|uniref:PhnB-like domain-containing protein n=1 Tax=Lithohypha guttulata TaxID=1690604 RepID=A0AAN7SV03_9EURO|nr:hypothetical protein LTR05_007389 [Lithohypha guttulata]
MSTPPSKTNDKICPCLWFDNNAEEAVTFYVNLFNSSPRASSMPSSSIQQTTHMPNETSSESGPVISIFFNLGDQKYMALNGGPTFKFTPAVSLMVMCTDQEEIDHFWDGIAGGVADREMNCGWVTDQYGLSWQIVPQYIRDLVEQETDRNKYNKLSAWMMKTMPKKLVIEDMVTAVEF